MAEINQENPALGKLLRDMPTFSASVKLPFDAADVEPTADDVEALEQGVHWQGTPTGTVATVTASGIIGPLAVAQHLGSTQAALLALGSGSAFLGHVNDAAFWMFKEYFGLSVGGTLKTWTAAHTLLSVTSFACILLLNAALT